RSLTVSFPALRPSMFRPNYPPVPFGALAGRHCHHIFVPVLFSALHAWLVKNGAEFAAVGQWYRPWYFPNNCDDLPAAVARECQAVRDSVGLLDASTLGSIDLPGPAARELLNRIYPTAWPNLDVGKARSGLMRHVAGLVFSYGVPASPASHHLLTPPPPAGPARR
ncbi:sarcosine oxidase subunit alpha, partial [Pseudomonas syringae]